MNHLQNDGLISKYTLRYLTFEHNHVFLVEETFSDNRVTQTKSLVDIKGMKDVISKISTELHPHIKALKDKDVITEDMVNNQVAFNNPHGKKGRNDVYKSAVELGMEAVNTYELALVNAIYSTVKTLKEVSSYVG